MEKGCHLWDHQGPGLMSAFVSHVHLLGSADFELTLALSGAVVSNLLPCPGMEMGMQEISLKVLPWDPHILPHVTSMIICIP